MTVLVRAAALFDVVNEPAGARGFAKTWHCSVTMTRSRCRPAESDLAMITIEAAEIGAPLNCC
jgi:hypothetical protein